jgi:hypothetical protein
MRWLEFGTTTLQTTEGADYQVALVLSCLMYIPHLKKSKQAYCA